MRDHFTEEQEQIIIDLYTRQHRGQLACAKAVGSTNVDKVKDVLRKYNIPIRNFSQAASLSNQNRAKRKNEDYFDTPSANMAWLLGFLASDGSISSSDNSIKIGLAAVDKEILEKIRIELDIENKINEYTTNNGFAVAELRWACAKHKEVLASYGITPKKTFTLQPPMQLPTKYWLDYIRGYFDGDGSVNLIHNKGDLSLRWKICGANKQFLQWIVDVLYNEYNIPKVNIQTQHRPTNDLYCFQYSTNATKQIYKILYTDGLYLARKKQHFDEIILMK